MAPPCKYTAKSTAKLWERQTGETTENYLAFAAFRDLGMHRTVRATFEKTGKSSVQYLGRLSGIWKWQERAAAWDEYLDNKAMQSQEDARVEAAKEHALIGRNVRNKYLDALEKTDPDKLPKGVLHVAIDMAIRIERTALGMGKEEDANDKTINIVWDKHWRGAAEKDEPTAEPVEPVAATLSPKRRSPNPNFGKKPKPVLSLVQALSAEQANEDKEDAI